MWVDQSCYEKTNKQKSQIEITEEIVSVEFNLQFA